MSDKVFGDTNVLLYARDVRQPAKQPVAWRWLERYGASGAVA